MSQEEEPIGGNMRCFLSFIGRWSEEDEAYYQKINSPEATEERIKNIVKLGLS